MLFVLLCCFSVAATRWCITACMDVERFRVVLIPET
jgi:hypothetical protein